MIIFYIGTIRGLRAILAARLDRERREKMKKWFSLNPIIWEAREAEEEIIFENEKI